jgi:hypothetical protein
MVAAPRGPVKSVHSGSGGPKLQVRTQTIVHHKESRPIWWSAMHGSQTVANTGTGTQPAPGTAAGSGTGAETGGGGGAGSDGSGAANKTAPCGSPVFFGTHAEYNPKDGSFNENVRVELTLANGETLRGDFHYPWHYPSEAENPFSPKTQVQDEPVPAQTPPPGYDISKEPQAVQLTLKYTTPNGTTLFEPCPRSAGL